MKSQDHKSTAEDGKHKTRPGIKIDPQVTHPILQIQQVVGNKTTTRLIQRHDDQYMNKYQFKVIDNETGEPEKLYAPSGGEESNESSRSASDIIGSKAGGEDDIYQD